MDLPYGRQTIGPSDVSAVARAVISPRLTQGPRVEEFERRLAEYVGTRHAISFSSGTAALHAAAAAAGVGRGRRFITTPISFVASANCSLYCGMRPRFVDVDPTTANLDPFRAATLARKFVDPVVLTVSLAGLPAFLPITNATIIEDACHALGATRRGRPVGQGTDMTVFSFHPVKAITTGEGGAVVTNDDGHAEAMREFRHHGIRRLKEDPDDPMQGGWAYDVVETGQNYRLTDIQCALGTEQLKRLDHFVAKRNVVANRYRELLDGLDEVSLPAETVDGDVHAYHLFVVRFQEGPNRRRTVYEHLRRQGIQTQLHYVPIPTLTAYQRMGYTMAGLPNAQAYHEQALSLPIFPTMTQEDVERVARELREALALPENSWKRSTIERFSSLEEQAVSAAH